MNPELQNLIHRRDRKRYNKRKGFNYSHLRKKPKGRREGTG